MSKKKRTGYLMVENYMDYIEIGKTDSDLKPGDFIDVRGRHYFVTFVTSDSRRSREHHIEIYLVRKDKLTAYMYRCMYYEKYYKLANKIRDFIAHPEKFKIKKVHLVR
jgi:hypothetical protein